MFGANAGLPSSPLPETYRVLGLFLKRKSQGPLGADGNVGLASPFRLSVYAAARRAA